MTTSAISRRAVERGERRGDRLRDQPNDDCVVPCNVLLTTAVAVDVCVVMRREEKGMGQMIDGSMSKKTPPPTELQIPITVTMLT